MKEKLPSDRHPDLLNSEASDSGGGANVPPSNSPPTAVGATQERPRVLPDRKLYQDEIYGTKELSPLALAIIDTPEFQRLGHIYQLGFTYTIFRGANHRRLDHSIGTYFMVRTLMRRIVQNHARLFADDPAAFAHPGAAVSPRLYFPPPGLKGGAQPWSPMGRWRGLMELISAAALLHDLGHVPVGHTLEDEFSVLEKHDATGGHRLFQMLYGPRTPHDRLERSMGAPDISDFFGPIETTRLPLSPRWRRSSLPWVFEQGHYENFFEPYAVSATSEAVAHSSDCEPLSNPEIRDLIYLILSFKEQIDCQPRINYKTFDEILRSELKAASSAYQTEPSTPALARLRRLEFIKALYVYYSRPIVLANHELDSLPLFHPFFADLISNTICADLLDYLVRDGKRLNLETRANPRLQRYLVIRKSSSFAGSSPTLRLTITAVSRHGLKRRDTVSELLDLMNERYRFAEVVYYHPKKAVFSTMLAKALELCSEDTGRPRDDDDVYPAPWTHTDVAIHPHIAHLGDESLTHCIAAKQWAGVPEQAADLARRIIYRDEYRLLFTLDHDAAMTDGTPNKFIQELRDLKDEGRRRAERLLEGAVRRALDAGWPSPSMPPVLIYCPNIRMQAKEVTAHVELTPLRVTPLNMQLDQDLSEEIRVLNAKYGRLWRLYLFVHPQLDDTTVESNDLLCGLVDTFLTPYNIGPTHIERGFAQNYEAFDERIDRHFSEWLSRIPKGGNADQIRHLLGSSFVWASALDSDDAPYPLTRAEYFTGFAFATAVAAADSSDSAQRKDWPMRLSSLRSIEWCLPLSAPAAESRRKAATNRLRELAESLSESHVAHGRAFTWIEFVKRVSTSLSTLSKPENNINLR